MNSACIVRNFLGKCERLKVLRAEHPYFTTTETTSARANIALARGDYQLKQLQQYSARVRQLKRTELAWRVESAQCLRLFSRSLNSCCRSYNRRSLSNVHRTFFTRKNQRFSGAPNARIVRQSRSFDRRKIRTLSSDKGKAILGFKKYINSRKFHSENYFSCTTQNILLPLHPNYKLGKYRYEQKR